MDAIPPKQRWHVRIVLKSGAVFDTVTEDAPEGIREACRQNRIDREEFVFINGLNQQSWPVIVQVNAHDVSALIISPHEVYLAARPSIVQ